jgi:hypothetical protein
MNRRVEKGMRKKGMPKWKNVVAEIDQLNKRLPNEMPPAGVHYYKYKMNASSDKNDQDEPTVKVIQNRRIVETDDKAKVKIRFSDLPLSKCTQAGLFKSKFIKMTEV